MFLSETHFARCISFMRIWLTR